MLGFAKFFSGRSLPEINFLLINLALPLKDIPWHKLCLKRAQHESAHSGPLIRRIKSWQLVCLGISGWVTIYSVAIIYWGASSFVVGNTQGGSFAAAMTLSALEVRRRQKGSVNPLQWADSITTEQLNVALTRTLQRNELLLEALHPNEAQMGFALHAVKAGRTFLFETGRWKERVIDLPHIKITEENRSKSNADFAVIVGAGRPDEETKIFAKTHPVKLLVGEELKAIFTEEKSSDTSAETVPIPTYASSLSGTRGGIAASNNKTGSSNKSTEKIDPDVKVTNSFARHPLHPIALFISDGDKSVLVTSKRRTEAHGRCVAKGDRSDKSNALYRVRCTDLKGVLEMQCLQNHPIQSQMER